MKKPISAFVLLLVLSLVALNVNLGYARLGPKGYWTEHVKDQYLPEAIENEFRQDDPAATSLAGNPANEMQKKSFSSNFSTRGSTLLYTDHTPTSATVGIIPKWENKPRS